MKAADLMTPSPACCSPDDTAQTIAQKMLESDCGCIPVVDSNRLVGVVTDRDLACRCLAQGLGPDTKAADIMSRDVGCCPPDADAKDVERVMSERQVRRVPIVDERGAVVGIVAQADLARAAKRDLVSDREVGIVLEQISEPTRSASADGSLGRSEIRL
jgi:CBS domain-containing protein